MIERPPAFALRQPEEAERAVRLVVLRLKRRGAAEGVGRLLRFAERHQRDALVVMRRNVVRVGAERVFETAQRIAVTALRRNGHAKVVRDGGIARHDGQRSAIGALGLRRPASLEPSHGVGDERAKFG